MVPEDDAAAKTKKRKEKPNIEALGGRLTCSVPEAGAMDDMTPLQAYRAAKKNVIPTIQINGRLRVPLAKWRAKLSGEVA